MTEEKGPVPKDERAVDLGNGSGMRQSANKRDSSLKSKVEGLQDLIYVVETKRQNMYDVRARC